MFNLLSSTNRGKQTKRFQQNQDGFSLISDRMNRTAYTTEDVKPGQVGRLHYLYTEWGAISADGSFIPKDTVVRPIMRKGNAWIVIADEQRPSSDQQVA